MIRSLLGCTVLMLVGLQMGCTSQPLKMSEEPRPVTAVTTSESTSQFAEVHCKVWGPLVGPSSEYQIINEGSVKFDRTALESRKKPMDTEGGCQPKEEKQIIGENTKMPITAKASTCGDVKPYFSVSFEFSSSPLALAIHEGVSNRLTLRNPEDNRLPASDYLTNGKGQFDFIYVDCNLK